MAFPKNFMKPGQKKRDKDMPKGKGGKGKGDGKAKRMAPPQFSAMGGPVDQY